MLLPLAALCAGGDDERGAMVTGGLRARWKHQHWICWELCSFKSLSMAFGRLLEAAMAEGRSKAELLAEFQMAGKNKIS